MPRNPLFDRLDLSLVFRPAFVEKSIYVLLSHQSFFGFDGGIERFAADGFIEFGGAIFPKRIGIDSSKNVGNISGESCYWYPIFIFFTLHCVLFLHILYNDYYYIINLSTSLPFLHPALYHSSGSPNTYFRTIFCRYFELSNNN